MSFLKCGTHGRQKETFVCRHIIETLKDHEPRGFCWDVVDGTHEAICSACNDLGEAEFQQSLDELIQGLCFGCFREAAQINGIILD